MDRRFDILQPAKSDVDALLMSNRPSEKSLSSQAELPVSHPPEDLSIARCRSVALQYGLPLVMPPMLALVMKTFM